MTLPVSPNPISFSQINTEEHITANTSGSLNDSDVRALAVVSSGTINFSDFYGKTSQTTSNYTSAVTAATFTVPRGVTAVNVSTIGGGGGGGGAVFSGDGHGAGNGGSGGYILQTIAVTPGEILTITVGAGGIHGTSSGTGGTGGTSTVSRGTTTLFSATGGAGGKGVIGDNAPAAGGAGGSPGGVAGSYQATWMVNRNTTGQGLNGKGTNGSGYGTGGLGGNAGQGLASTAGGLGAVIFSW